MHYLPQQVLARAEADLEPDILDRRGKIIFRIAARLKHKRQLRQKRFEQLFLMRGKRRTFAATEEFAAHDHGGSWFAIAHASP